MTTSQKIKKLLFKEETNPKIAALSAYSLGTFLTASILNSDNSISAKQLMIISSIVFFGLIVYAFTQIQEEK
jgi:hypothetical protein